MQSLKAQEDIEKLERIKRNRQRKLQEEYEMAQERNNSMLKEYMLKQQKLREKLKQDHFDDLRSRLKRTKKMKCKPIMNYAT